MYCEFYRMSLIGCIATNIIPDTEKNYAILSVVRTLQTGASKLDFGVNPQYSKILVKSNLSKRHTGPS